MSKKLFIKIAIDLMMTLLMLLAFAYQLTGNLTHEVVGIVIFALFGAHTLMNWQWYKTLPKGRRSTHRVVSITVNLLLLADMALLAISSVMVSRDLLGFLDINGGFAVRQLHTLASYWGLILLSIHLGMHWSMILGAIRKIAGLVIPNRITTLVLRILAILITAYGIQASFDMNIGSKLILYYTFDYWDFDKSALVFFLSTCYQLWAYMFVQLITL